MVHLGVGHGLEPDIEAVLRHHTEQMAKVLDVHPEALWRQLTAPVNVVEDYDPLAHQYTDRECPLVGGAYRHYKGTLYKVVAVAQSEGTRERQVVYRGADGHVWVRPLAQWFQIVRPNEGDRTPVKRFTFEAESSPVSGQTD